jgi:hypothetical protein
MGCLVLRLGKKSDFLRSRGGLDRQYVPAPSRRDATTPGAMSFHFDHGFGAACLRNAANTPTSWPAVCPSIRARVSSSMLSIVRANSNANPTKGLIRWGDL